MRRLCSEALLIVIGLLFVLVVCAQSSEAEDHATINLISLNGVQARITYTTERHFLTDYDTDGPVTTVIEEGCKLDFTPMLTATETIRVELELNCKAIKQPVSTVRKRTPFGRQKVQQPEVRQLMLKTVFEAADGEPVVLKELAEAPSIVATSYLIDTNSLNGNMARLELMLPREAIGGVEQTPSLFKELKLAGINAQKGTIYDLSKNYLVTGFEEKDDPVTEILETGCTLGITPLLMADGRHINLDVLVGCKTIDEPVETFKVRTRFGRQKIHLPVVHNLQVETVTLISDGQTFVIGGLRTDRADSVFFLTPRAFVADTVAVDISVPSVFIEARIISKSQDAATISNNQSRDQFLEELRLLAVNNETASFDNQTEQFMIIGNEKREPVIEAITSGCSVVATPHVSSDGQVLVDTELTCHRLETPSNKSRTKTLCGRRKLELPVVRTLQIHTRFFSGDGQTLLLGGVLSEQREALVLATPHLIISRSLNLQPPLVRLEMKAVEVTGGDTGGIADQAGTQLLRELQLASFNNQEAILDDLTTAEIVIKGKGFRRVKVSVETGISVAFLPMVAPDGNVLVDLSLVWRTLSKPEGNPPEKRPWVELIVLDTQFSAMPGQTILLAGGIRKEDEASAREVLVIATLDLVGTGPGAEVEITLKLLRA